MTSQKIHGLSGIIGLMAFLFCTTLQAQENGQPGNVIMIEAQVLESTCVLSPVAAMTSPEIKMPDAGLLQNGLLNQMYTLPLTGKDEVCRHILVRPVENSVMSIVPDADGNRILLVSPGKERERETALLDVSYE